MTIDVLQDILAEARDRIMAHLATNDEFLHQLRERGDDSLQRNESVRDHVERVLNEMEGLRRRLAVLAGDE